MRTFATILIGIMAFGGMSPAPQHEAEGDRSKVLEFIRALRICVAENNRSCAAGMVAYPIALASDQGTEHKKLIVANADDLVRHFNEVFSPQVRATLSDDSDATLTFSWGHVYVLGTDHQIWFERSDGNFKVTAIGVTKYHLAGIENSSAAEDFFRDFQKAVKTSDKARVCSMIEYPITVVLNHHPVTFAEAAQLSRSYDVVFNANVRNAVLHQVPSHLRANWRGLIVGDGEIWFTLGEDPNVFKITAINP